MSLAIDVEQITAVVLTSGLRYEVVPGEKTSMDAFELLDNYHSPGRWLSVFQPRDRCDGIRFQLTDGRWVAMPAEHIMLVEFNPSLKSQRDD